MIDTASKFQTGSQWVHLPTKYGSRKGVYTRLRNWAIDDTWKRVFTALLAQADAEGDLDWVVSVDSTIVRAHQNAAGARQKGAPADEPAHHAIGRSCGGLSTKIHLVADGKCRPLCFHLTPGQARPVDGPAGRVHRNGGRAAGRASRDAPPTHRSPRRMGRAG
ncbi:hypothetical protein AB0E08_30965 [Streptomyces sp. NPDC048281]|uniref:hypothetical protein n=1 Tax=Streptomyces sp. NPDC048281 TaxID=3154715 RepID=UPI003443E3D0